MKLNKIINNIIIILLIIFNYLLPFEKIPPISHSNWELLQLKPVKIDWTSYGTFQWCRSQHIISAPIENIQLLLENKSNYPQVFKRIEKTTILPEGNVHIVLDMPFPFHGRDYIVNYSQTIENNDIIYRYTAAKNHKIPIYKDYVRLINAAGEWRLRSIDASNTQVTYIWNGELLGDFPSWALTRAWITQGQEVMNWLYEAIK